MVKKFIYFLSIYIDSEAIELIFLYLFNSMGDLWTWIMLSTGGGYWRDASGEPIFTDFK